MRFKQCSTAPLTLLYSLCCPSVFKWTPSYDKYEREARQNPRCVQYMAKGSGSKTPWRYCARICTFALNAPTGCLLTVWPTQTKRTPYSLWSKQTKSSMAEPTDAGEDRRRVRSLVPICKITTSGLKRSTSVKSNRLTLSIVRPPTPCQWIVTGVLMFKLRLYVGLFLIIKSRSLRIKEWPKIRTLGCSIPTKKKNTKELAWKIWTDNLPHDGVEVERGPRICATYYKAILDHMFPSTQFTQPVPDNNRYPDAKL